MIGLKGINHKPTGAGFCNHPPYHFGFRSLSGSSGSMGPCQFFFRYDMMQPPLTPIGVKSCEIPHAPGSQDHHDNPLWPLWHIYGFLVCDSTMVSTTFSYHKRGQKTHPPARSSRPVCWDRCTRVWTSASHGSCRRSPGRSWVGCPQFCLSILGGKYGAGWWCNNHLEKYESQWEGWQPIYEMENTNMFETTNQGVAFLLWESSQHVTTNMGISPTKKGRPQLMDFDNPT